MAFNVDRKVSERTLSPPAVFKASSFFDSQDGSNEKKTALIFPAFSLRLEDFAVQFAVSFHSTRSHLSQV